MPEPKAVLLTFLLLAFAGPARAEDERAAAEPELRNPTVVVTGSRQEQAEAFVNGVQPQGWQSAVRGVPRWNSELCISVIGPPVAQGQFIADRISQRAMDVGLEAGAPGCDTNLLIIVTAEPQDLLSKMAERDRGVFGYSGDAKIDTSGSDVTLSSFISSDRPVRWRQVIETIGADGMPLDGDPRTGAGGIPTNLPIVRGDATRLRSNVYRQLSRVITVVDARQTAGLSLAQVSDYLAFVTLADVDPEANLSAFPSILNLFNPQAEHLAGLSDWDVAFLDGLYSTRLDGAGGRMQYREIVGRVAISAPTGE